MMYRRKIEAPAPKRRVHYPIKVMPMLVSVAFIGVIIGAYGFIKKGKTVNEIELASFIARPSEKGIVCNRISREAIPPLNLNTVNYAELFNDTNATQLEAARRNGVKNPAAIGDPSKCKELVKVQSNSLYVVDTLTYSKPYLVPEAALLLQFIGERFQELLAEQYPGKHYRPIVTSVLRSEEDVTRLRRRNRNATESSCHIYGTTVDITYNRFRLTDNTDTVDHNEIYLKNLLTQVLYELRYEGLIYVKYERRQACYHLTLRNSQYQGKLKSEKRTYKDIPNLQKTNPKQSELVAKSSTSPSSKQKEAESSRKSEQNNNNLLILEY